MHESVKNALDINEKCEDIQETKKCEFRDEQLTQILEDNILSDPLEIEEIASISQKMKICGYYASRNAAQQADIIVTPYQSILSESTRNSLGISILNKVVVFDEAHNIMETISSLNSVTVAYSQFYIAYSQIQQYLRKYELRLSAKNSKFLRDVSQICADFSKYLKNYRVEPKEFGVDVMEILTELDLYRIDFAKLLEFFDKVDLTRKISGFIQSQQQNNERVWSTINMFIKVLSLSPLHGKFILRTSQKVQEISLEYICLNPSIILNRMCDEVKKLVFASGTLEPAADFDLVKSKKHKFQCGHIIGPDQFKAILVDAGFNFQFQQRDQMLLKMAELIKWTFQKQSLAIGGGLVVFVQSYQMQLKFRQIFDLKQVFWEEQGSIDVFFSYQQKIKEGTPSILICVIGGKLSEGINFSDDLARTVIVFGLPFPNNKSQVIQEKMKFYDTTEVTGKQYYENLCMKTLNQAIGRAIRHINDYACIVIADSRIVVQQQLQMKLPGWIKSRIKIAGNIKDFETELNLFYKSKILL